MGYNRATFGIGSITAIPLGANPTPQDFAVVTGATVDFKSTEVLLRGQKMMPVASATSEASVSGKITAKDFAADIVGLVLPGITSATGSKKMTSHKAAIPTTPFQITVTQSAQFSKNLGVVDQTTGEPMDVVASSPAAGQYSYAAGVYTFASADVGHNVVIRYSYTTTTGTTYTAANVDTGSTVGFEVELWAPDASTLALGITGLTIPNAKFSNLSAALKANEFAEISLDFSAFEDATGVYLMLHEA